MPRHCPFAYIAFHDNSFYLHDSRIHPPLRIVNRILSAVNPLPYYLAVELLNLVETRPQQLFGP